MMKKVRTVLIWVSAFVIVCVASCRHYEARYAAGYFPEPIKPGRVILSKPGCDVFWCAGGRIFRLNDKQAALITSGGVPYLNSLGAEGRNGRPIAEWVSSDDLEAPILLMLDNYHSQYTYELEKKIIASECFLSSRRAEPTLVLCPSLNIAYSGWFD